jgi:small subunit ribosomal protein S20
MPQLEAGAKALRKNKRQRAVNDIWRKKIRESLKTIRIAITNKDKKAIDAELKKAESILDRAARRNIIHPNKAARKKSRLQKAAKAIA